MRALTGLGIGLLAWVSLVSAGCAERGEVGALRVDVTTTGWSNVGLTGEARRFVPTVEFVMRNVGSVPVENVDVFFSFWPAGADGEKDTQQVAGVRTGDIAPGGSSGTLVIRSAVGYNLAGLTTSLFAHSQFQDWFVKVYGRRGGRTTAMGEFPIARHFVDVERGSNLIARR
jgi:hypothetical protein